MNLNDKQFIEIDNLISEKCADIEAHYLKARQEIDNLRHELFEMIDGMIVPEECLTIISILDSQRKRLYEEMTIYTNPKYGELTDADKQRVKAIGKELNTIKNWIEWLRG